MRRVEEPCREDLAVFLRYEMVADTFSDLELHRLVRDKLGRFTLQEVPGR